MTAVLLFDKREAIKTGNPVYLRRYGTLYRDFRTDGEWYCFQYYPLFIMRRLFFAMFLIALIHYPERQCNAFIFSS
jgi:hypothetical protein